MKVEFLKSRASTLATVPMALIALLVSGIGTAHADANEKAEIAAVRLANITPLSAVARAQKRSGGEAFGMGLEVSRHGTWYEIQVNVHGKPMLARIDPHNGAWLGMGPAHGEDAQGLHTLDGRKVTLSDAIATAERAAQGRALEAGPYGHGKDAHYDVDVVHKDGSIAHLSVDADSGLVRNAPASEAD
jgi:uncharacterized membrane protein YkoI